MNEFAGNLGVLRQQVKPLSDKAKQWIVDNAKAFECWNRFVEQHGLPLEKYRSF